MIKWVIENELARTSRPGYPDEQGPALEQSEVEAWLAEARAFGIKSIICLLAEDQLKFYHQLPFGLVAYYREAGFNVEHVPERDYQSPPLSQASLDNVWQAFQTLPKPILIHCSAGIDRTGSAVRHIQQTLRTIGNEATMVKRIGDNE